MQNTAMAVRCSFTALFHLLFCFMIRQLCYGTVTDIQCLKKLKASVDPDNKLEWPLRLKIAIGSPRGLAWLHHSCNTRILHRNISSKCILLDDDYEPKISDFGLARLTKFAN
jgi:serine/threonine protein kinase